MSQADEKASGNTSFAKTTKMEEERLLKCIREGNIASLSMNVKAYLNLRFRNEELTYRSSFIGKLFRSIVLYLNCTELKSPDDIENIIQSCISCLNHMSDYTPLEVQNTQIERSLYHIIKIVLDNKFYEESMILTDYLKNILEKCFLVTPNSKELNIISSNILLIFWNSAITLEGTGMENSYKIGLHLRTVALTFQSLNPEELYDLSQKSLKVLNRYSEPNNLWFSSKEVLKFCNTLWNSIIHREIKMPLFSWNFLLFQMICKWDSFVSKHVTDENILSQISFWLQFIKNSNDKIIESDKRVVLFQVCLDISISYYNFLNLKISIPFDLLEKWHNVLQIKSGIQRTKEEYELLSVMCNLLTPHLSRELFRLISSDKPQNVLPLQLPQGIQIFDFIVKFCIVEFLSVADGKGKLLPHAIDTSMILADGLLQLYPIILNQEHADPSCTSKLISMANEFKDFVSAYLSFKPELEFDKYQHRFAIGIGNMGIICFKKNLFKPAIPFFTFGIRLLSSEGNIESSSQASLWKNQQLLAHCYSKIDMYYEALQVAAQTLFDHAEKISSSVELWLSIKKYACVSGKTCILKMTISDVLKDCKIPLSKEKEAVALLQILKAFGQGRSSIEEEIAGTISRLLIICPTGLNRARALVNVMEIYSTTNEEMVLPQEFRSLKTELCEEAIAILKENILLSPDDVSLKLELSVAYFWMYHVKLVKAKHAAKEEVEKPAFQPINGADNLNGPIVDEEDKNDKCDIKAKFASVTLSTELEILEFLSEALNIWLEFSCGSNKRWLDVIGVIHDLNLLNIIRAAAESFALSSVDFSEIQAWIVLQDAAHATCNSIFLLTALHSMASLLMRRGYLKMTGSIILHFEEQLQVLSNDDSQLEKEKLRFSLVKSEYLLRMGQFQDGFEELLKIVKDPVLKKLNKKSILLLVESHLLSSAYVLLPSSIFEDNDDSQNYFVQNTAHNLALECLKKCLVMMKFQHKSLERASTSRTSMLWYTPLILRLLMKSALIVGELYTEIGAPREARCYLQESLLVAQKNILTFWSSKILIVLAHIDLKCDNLEDCHVKVNGLKYMLREDLHENRKGEICNENEKGSFSRQVEEEEEEEGVIKDCKFLCHRSGRSVRGQVRQQLLPTYDMSSSPPLTYHQQKKDVVISSSHLDSCCCVHCSFSSVQIAGLETVVLDCMLLMAKGSKNIAHDNLCNALKDYEIIIKKQSLSTFFYLIKLSSVVKDSSSFVLQKSDMVLFVQIFVCLNILDVQQNNYSSALDHLSSAMDKMRLCANNPKIFCSNLYALIIYQKVVTIIRMINSSKLNLKPSGFTDCWLGWVNSGLSESTPELTRQFSSINICDTPDDNLPLIRISDFSSVSSNVCKAPVKREIFSSTMKKSVDALSDSPKSSRLQDCNSPISLDFCSSGDDCAFVSCNSDYESNSCTVKQQEFVVSGLKSKIAASKSRTKDSTKSSNSLNKKKTSGACLRQWANKNSQSRTTCSSKYKPRTAPETPQTSNKFFKIPSHDINIKCSEDIWSSSLNPLIGGRQRTEKKNSSTKFIPKAANCLSVSVLPSEPQTTRKKCSRKTKSENRLESPNFECELIINSKLEPCVKTPANCRLKKVIKDEKEFKNAVESSRATRTVSSSSTIMKSSISENNKQFSKTKNLSKVNTLVFSDANKHSSYIKTPISTSVAMESVKNVKLSCPSLSETCNIPGMTLEEMLLELGEAFSLISHNPPCPLYSDLCLLLALLSPSKATGHIATDSNSRLHISYLISESFANTLRHQALISLIKMLKSSTEDEKNVKDNACNFTKRDVRRDVQFQKKVEHINFRKWAVNETFSKRMKEMKTAFLPEWTVVQICAIPENVHYSKSATKLHVPKLMICRMQQNSEPCISIVDNTSDPLFQTNFLSQFENILNESSTTLTTKDVKVWWTLRRSLDKQMKELVESMENVWLGYWKGLFLGLPCNEERLKQLDKAVFKVSEHAESLGCNPAEVEMLKVFLDSASYLSPKQLSQAICFLWQLHPGEVSHNLSQYIQNVTSNLVDTKRKPVLLILDKLVQGLPWECIPMLRDHPVTRIPSVSLLTCQLESYYVEESSLLFKGVESNRAFYIVNPGGDIPNTQEMFEKVFKQQHGWKGIVGRVPTSNEFISAITDYDLFLYCGHGTGKSYLEGQHIHNISCQAVTFLMGCSSGRLKLLGKQLEPVGVPLEYWLGGCPCIVANLWDVTDRDIDRFTNTLLETWLPNYSGLSNPQEQIADAISIARSSCRLPFLIGAAPVIYGLPVFIKN